MQRRVILMKDEFMSPIALVRTENKRKKRIPQLVCSVILYFALAVIVLLAIPTGLFLGAIAGVWALAGNLIRLIEGSGRRSESQ